MILPHPWHALHKLKAHVLWEASPEPSRLSNDSSLGLRVQCACILYQLYLFQYQNARKHKSKQFKQEKTIFFSKVCISSTRIVCSIYAFNKYLLSLHSVPAFIPITAGASA